MTEQDQDYLWDTLSNEGFEYAFLSYSTFDEIEDERFHELRREFIRAHQNLSEYIGWED